MLNGIVMLEFDYFFATGAGVTGYMVWRNWLPAQKHVLGWFYEAVTYM